MLGYNTKSTSSLGQQKISISQLDTGGQKSALLSLDGTGKIEYLPKSDLTINVDQLDPSNVQNDVLVTNSSLQLQWQKINTNNTTFADQNLLTSSTPSFSQTSLQNAASQNTHSIRKQEHDISITNMTNYINTQVSSANTYSDNQNTNLSSSLQTIMDSKDQVILQQANTYTDNHQFSLQDNSITEPKYQSLSISTRALQDDSVTDAKIPANTISVSKIVHPNSANKVLLTRDNTTTPQWNFISSLNLEDGCISTNKILDLNVTQAKMSFPRHARQLWVCFQTGTDSVNNGSQAKPLKTLQYAIDQAQTNSFVLNVLSPSVDEDVVINNKLQLTLKFLSSTVYNSPGQTCRSISITNSSSIKIVGCQVDARTFAKHAVSITNSPGVYIKDCTILADSTYGLYINNQSTYTQLESVECSLFLQQSLPASLCTIVCSKNTSITNAFSNTVNNYTLACENCTFQNQVSFSGGSLIASKSQFYALLSFSSSSPNIMLLMNTLHMSTLLAAQLIQKSGTSFWCVSNDSIFDPSSSFSGTEVLQRKLDYGKIANSTTPNRYLKFNNSGQISLQDLSTEQISNNQIISLNANKLIEQSPYSNLLLRSNNDGTVVFGYLKNSDIQLAEIGINKISGAAGSSGQILQTNGSTVSWVNAPQSIVYNNDADNLLDGTGSWTKINTLAKFDSANTVASQYVSGSQCIFWGQNNVDASTAQIRYFNIPNAINDFSPARCINVGKINFGNDNRYSIPVQVTSSSFGSLQPGHFPGWSFSKALCNIWNGGGSASTPLDQYLHTNASTGDLEWASISTSIADGSVTTAKLADSAVTTLKITDANITTAKIADSAITTAKINDNQVTAAKLTANSVSNLKIVDNAVDLNKLAFVSGVKTNNRAVCIRNGNLQILDSSINPGVLLSTLETYNPGFGTSHAVSNQINYPFFQSSIPNSTYNITPQISTLFNSANGVYSMNQKSNSQFSPACGWSTQENSSGVNWTIGFVGTLTGGTGALTSSNGLICSNFSSNIACIFKSLGNDNAQITSGSTANSPTVYLNQNGTLSVPSSQALKQTITQLSRQKDEDFAKDFVKNVNLYSYTYNTSNAEVLRHSKKECQCQNETQCKDLLYSAYEKAVQRNIGFLAEEVLPYQTIQLQRTQKNVCSKTKQLLIDQGMPIDLANEMHQKALETESKYEEQISRQDVSTVLFLEVKRLQKENEALKTRLNRICEILNING